MIFRTSCSTSCNDLGIHLAGLWLVITFYFYGICNDYIRFIQAHRLSLSRMIFSRRNHQIHDLQSSVMGFLKDSFDTCRIEAIPPSMIYIFIRLICFIAFRVEDFGL